MAASVTPPRGMRDFLPAEKARREHALGVIRGVYAAHGFDEIETPVMEDSSRLHAGLGGDNEKIAFAVMKRGLTHDDLEAAAASGDALSLADLGLRYDLTVPLARFYATHRAALPPVFRAIQIAPVWRAERPQKGRYRQFVQCDIDIIGEAGFLAELELLTATIDTLDALGLGGCTIRLNDRRILAGILGSWGVPAELRERALITIDKLDKIGVGGVAAELAATAASSTRMSRPSSRRSRPPTGTCYDRAGVADRAECLRRPRGSTWRRTRDLARASRGAARRGRSSSTRPSCAAWGTTRARSSRSPTPTSATRSAAAAATTT